MDKEKDSNKYQNNNEYKEDEEDQNSDIMSVNNKNS